MARSYTVKLTKLTNYLLKGDLTVRNIFSMMVIVFFATVVANGEKSVVLPQNGSPLKITKYEATFQPEERRSYDSHPEQIRHGVSCQNVSGKPIVAYQIGLVAFDTFNNLLGKFNGWAIETVSVDATANVVWTQRPYAAFSFRSYGTGVAYVNAVRFEDGLIWRADLAEVLTELQKFEKDLNKEDLKEKKGN
jgi:hypothetical protein